MIKKIFEQIRVYRSFQKEIDFAVEELEKIIEWLNLSKFMGIIENGDYEDCYHYAIDSIVDLKEYKRIIESL